MKIISEPKYTKRVADNLCVVIQCKNSSGKGNRFCFKHKREWQKINNPLRYWFDVLRQNAKRRAKEFTLTIEEFKEFCEREKYLEYKGRANAGNYTIDRRNDKLGYTKDNIFVLTLSQNSRKRWIDLKLQFGHYPTDAELEEFYGGVEYFNEHIKPHYDEEIQTEPEEEVPF